jgi:hypothetical protein
VTKTWTLEFPYRRSTGEVVGRFLQGLAERRVVGVRTASGRVLVPPLEYDPETGEPVGELVDVGTGGVVVQHAWVTAPGRHHVRDRPFAWVLVRLDGADTAIVHVLDAPVGDVRTGMRVRVRWRAEREGKITDIECFEPESA